MVGYKGQHMPSGKFGERRLQLVVLIKIKSSTRPIVGPQIKNQRTEKEPV